MSPSLESRQIFRFQQSNQLLFITLKVYLAQADGHRIDPAAIPDQIVTPIIRLLKDRSSCIGVGQQPYFALEFGIRLAMRSLSDNLSTHPVFISASIITLT